MLIFCFCSRQHGCSVRSNLACVMIELNTFVAVYSICAYMMPDIAYLHAAPYALPKQRVVFREIEAP